MKKWYVWLISCGLMNTVAAFPFAQENVTTFQPILNYGLYVNSNCCQTHVGICGCLEGKLVCCDGETSPYCNCSFDAIAEKLISCHTR